MFMQHVRAACLFVMFMQHVQQRVQQHIHTERTFSMACPFSNDMQHGKAT
jgi:hypothetical protein